MLPRPARLPVAVLLSALVGCTPPPPANRETPPAAVSVVAAERKTVPVQVRTIGSVKVLETVALRPQSRGRLTGVHFKEGDYVTKGQKLFTIDPRIHDPRITEATVKLAEATAEKSKTALGNAQIKLDQLKDVKGGGVSVSEMEAAKAAVALARATLAVDEAAVASAKLELEETTINSPLDGRVGEVLVKKDNLVDETTPSLVVVNQVSPISVTFALPEPQLPAVAAARRDGPLKVEAYLRDGQPPIPGVLAFIDNAVNTGSGTVMLKAEFANADRKLWPGQFVDVVLTVRERPDSVVVPAAAVQAGQKGQYVYVVTADNKAELRPVTVAFDAGGEAVIEAGLSGGERVVTAGHLRLVPGAAVTTKAAGGKE